MFDLKALVDSISAFGVDAVFYPLAVAMGLLIQYGRGLWRSFGEPQTLAVGCATGLLAACTAALDHHEGHAHGPLFLLIQTVGVSAAVLVSWSLWRKAAEKLTFIPQDNQWVAPKA